MLYYICQCNEERPKNGIGLTYIYKKEKSEVVVRVVVVVVVGGIYRSANLRDKSRSVFRKPFSKLVNNMETKKRPNYLIFYETLAK